MLDGGLEDGDLSLLDLSVDLNGNKEADGLTDSLTMSECFGESDPDDPSSRFTVFGDTTGEVTASMVGDTLIMLGLLLLLGESTRFSFICENELK